MKKVSTTSNGVKRILIFSLTYHPFIGGAEIAIKEITDRINRKDIEFHMVTLRFDNKLSQVEQVGNVLVHRIGITTHKPKIDDLRKFPLHLNKFIFQFSAALKALQLHRKYHYDGIWAMMAHSSGVPAGIFKFFAPHTPYLLTLQEGDPIPHIKRTMLLLYPLFMRAFTSANIVQVISTYLGRWARGMGFKGPLVVIPNGVDIEHFTQALPHEASNLLKKEEGVYLITTSRLVKKNAIDDVIRALMYLPEHIHFLILGTGPDEEKLKGMVQEGGLEERVHFLGHVDNQEIPKYLHQSDIFIRPSRSEGMGNSFIEAMAAGLPVIGTQEGGIADFLYDPKRNQGKIPTGFAVDSNDPKGIARQVKNILENRDTTKEIVINAKKLVLEKYDWDIIAKNMHKKVFKKLW